MSTRSGKRKVGSSDKPKPKQAKVVPSDKPKQAKVVPSDKPKPKQAKVVPSDKPKHATAVSVFEGAVHNTEAEVRKRDGYTAELPRRNSDGVLIFKDCETLRPNLTPKEILQGGSFGGTYFRAIKSSVTSLQYDQQWLELPQVWLEDLDINNKVASCTYNETVNTYGKKCGGDLNMWESSGWIRAQDPYGWFQWYCRFYLGRRTDDDDRQIRRWRNCAGLKGRWRNTLIGKIVKTTTTTTKTDSAYDNMNVSPVIRQTLQHWGYRLSREDFEARREVLRNK